MKNTIRDFWKMIHERQCASVVMLCETMEDGKVSYSVYLYICAIVIVTYDYLQEACAPYWPESGTFTYGDMIVTSASVVEAKEFTTRVFKITDKVCIVCTVTTSKFSQLVLSRVHNRGDSVVLAYTASV